MDIPSFRYDGILKDHEGLEYGAAEVGKDYNPDSDKWKRDKMKLIILMNDLLANLQRYAAHRRLGVDNLSVVGVLNSGRPPLYIHWILYLLIAIGFTAQTLRLTSIGGYLSILTCSRYYDMPRYADSLLKLKDVIWGLWDLKVCIHTL